MLKRNYKPKMRLLLKFKSTKNSEIAFPYYLQIQGLIYNLLRKTKFGQLHKEKVYKFFCFSNIFAEKENSISLFKKGKLYNLIISSPDENFIKTLAKGFIEKKEIKIKDSKFELSQLKFFNLNLKNKTKIVSISPIIIRIPKQKYKDYGISLSKSYPYLFWRPQYPFEAFLKQLEDNIFKKYKRFYQKEIEEFPIFQKFIFKKSVSLPLKIHGKKVNYIGSLWEFHFDFLDKKTKEILNFAIDCGFGEKNPMGFGFVNLR